MSIFDMRSVLLGFFIGVTVASFVIGCLFFSALR